MPVTDAELRAALEQALGGPLLRVGRRPHPYHSTHPVEDLAVLPAAGVGRRLLLKDLGATCCGDLGDRARLLDARREIEAYRVLASRGVSAPACVAAAPAPRRDRGWLVLEAVDAAPLWQHEGLGAWLAAARWLAALHGGGPPRDARHLLVHDRAHARQWLRRAVATTPPGALAAVAVVWETALARLAAWPATFLHGEFYASNVLVDAAGTVRPVDWEMAGVGPGVLDLAALVAGWPGAERRRLVAAYHAALPAGRRPPADELDVALTCARLQIAVQWLGWSPGWKPTAAHARDWLGEARALAGELAA